jgi:hypothetical protein
MRCISLVPLLGILKKTERLKNEWIRFGKVSIGGSAFNDRGSNFVGGLYVKQGVTITSRGCPNNGGFCFVPNREGNIRELPIVEGNIIQDNNLLACSRGHLANVFEMLKTQKHIDFTGGFEKAKEEDERRTEERREEERYQEAQEERRQQERAEEQRQEDMAREQQEADYLAQQQEVEPTEPELNNPTKPKE